MLHRFPGEVRISTAMDKRHQCSFPEFRYCIFPGWLAFGPTAIALPGSRDGSGDRLNQAHRAQFWEQVRSVTAASRDESRRVACDRSRQTGEMGCRWRSELPAVCFALTHPG